MFTERNISGDFALLLYLLFITREYFQCVLKAVTPFFRFSRGILCLDGSYFFGHLYSFLYFSPKREEIALPVLIK